MKAGGGPRRMGGRGPKRKKTASGGKRGSLTTAGGSDCYPQQKMRGETNKKRSAKGEEGRGTKDNQRM